MQVGHIKDLAKVCSLNISSKNLYQKHRRDKWHDLDSASVLRDAADNLVVWEHQKEVARREVERNNKRFHKELS